MIVPVVMCSGPPGPHPTSSLHLDSCARALTNTLKLVAWFDTAVLCLAPHADQAIVRQALSEQNLNGHLLLSDSTDDAVLSLSLAAAHLGLLGLDPLMLICPVNQVIQDAGQLAHALRQAQAAAQAGAIVVVGVPLASSAPTEHSGWIRAGAYRQDGCHAVIGFGTPRDSLPDHLQASAVLRNTGLYLGRASTWMDALATHAPAAWCAGQAAIADAAMQGPTKTPGLHCYQTDTADRQHRSMQVLERDVLAHLPNLAVIALHDSCAAPAHAYALETL